MLERLGGSWRLPFRSAAAALARRPDAVRVGSTAAHSPLAAPRLPVREWEGSRAEKRAVLPSKTKLWSHFHGLAKLGDVCFHLQDDLNLRAKLNESPFLAMDQECSSPAAWLEPAQEASLVCMGAESPDRVY